MKFSLGQFTDLFKVKSKRGLPFVLIGGQAVNYWAELFLDQEPDLAQWRPFTSEDIDFHGSREDVQWMAAQLGLQAAYPRPVEMTALAGMIPLKMGDLKSQIEFVRTVPGVPDKLLEGAALEAAWGQNQIRVMDPVSLLYGKAHLALKVSQEKRRDAVHLAIMVVCVRAFLRVALDQVEKGNLPARNWLSGVERTMALPESAIGKKAVRRFGIDWQEVLPMKEILKSTVPKIVSFREKRLKQWQAKMGS